MALVTHGTTLAGFKAIMAGEGKSLDHAPWTVSDNDGTMYFYDVASVGEDYGCETEHGDAIAEEWQNAIGHTANLSFEAARLQYASKGEGGKVVVLVCDVPDDMLSLDYSCHGDSSAMPNARSIECCEFDTAWIVDIKVCDFNPWNSVAALLCVWDNPMFNKCEVPTELAAVVDALSGGENYNLIDTLYDFDLESVDVQEFIKENA